MFTNPHNQNLLNDIMRVLSGETTETPIKPVPQWITEAAEVAASDIRSVLSEGGVVTSETRRDILRKHLSSAIEECNCSVSGETPLQFEEEVRKVEIEEARMGMGRPNEPLSRTLKRAAKAMKISGKAPPKPTTTKPPEKKEEVEDGEVDSVNEAKFNTNDLLDSIESAYKKGGLKGVIQGGKQFGLIDRTTVDELLDSAKSMFGADLKKAATEIKGFLKPQDYAKYKSKMESVEESNNWKQIYGTQEETERINEIVDGLREFVLKLSEEEVSVLRTIINENN